MQNVVSVGTASTQIGFVPAGKTIVVQVIGAHDVTLSLNRPAVATKGIVLKGGTPGGSFSTLPPGEDDDETWYAIAKTAATTVAVQVI